MLLMLVSCSCAWNVKVVLSNFVEAEGVLCSLAVHSKLLSLLRSPDVKRLIKLTHSLTILDAVQVFHDWRRNCHLGPWPAIQTRY